MPRRYGDGDTTGILDKFYVEHGVQGGRVKARTLQLTAGCLSDAEIKGSIQMLNDDLDACEKEMKRLVRLNSSGSLFEGWPTANDYIVTPDRLVIIRQQRLRSATDPLRASAVELNGSGTSARRPR